MHPLTFLSSSSTADWSVAGVGAAAPPAACCGCGCVGGMITGAGGGPAGAYDGLCWTAGGKRGALCVRLRARAPGGGSGGAAPPCVIHPWRHQAPHPTQYRAHDGLAAPFGPQLHLQTSDSPLARRREAVLLRDAFLLPLGGMLPWCAASTSVARSVSAQAAAPAATLRSSWRARDRALRLCRCQVGSGKSNDMAAGRGSG